MCEVGKRRWQEEGTHPVITSETTANSDRALINSSHTHIHIQNEGTVVYRRYTAQPYISTVSHSDDFSIYKPSPGLLANGKIFFLEDKHSEKICFCWWHNWNQPQATWEYFWQKILWDPITSGSSDECIWSAATKGAARVAWKQRSLREFCAQYDSLSKKKKESCQ